jgi:hypothetical protein
MHIAGGAHSGSTRRLMSPQGQNRKSSMRAHVFRFAPDSVAKLLKWLATNFPRKDETSDIADRCVLKRAIEVAVGSSPIDIAPRMIIRSPRLRAGKIAAGHAQRLLQHYPPKSGHRAMQPACPFRADTVEKVPNCFVTNFQPNDEMSDNRSSMCRQARYRSPR